ncbi:ABC1 kinase family protein [Nonomuraea endophytica]|uniref:Ubiquinone biosynthesis protein n=1 Tax=Nonomuraea endophytica TaxID=714136 RepID=A0A7W8A2S0_9ACTN|nr:AarF/UbiB family protein [Nonomuraea endophytica]MBB5078448.1 ubiquinone biosynthesis protein [Nonomuraea endophytica]
MDLLTPLSLAAVAWLAAVVARRALGIPVGWPRTIVVGFFVTSAIGSAVTSFSEFAGIVADGRIMVSMPAAYLVLSLVIAWLFVLGLTALVVLEVVVPTGTLPSPLDLLKGWKARRRRTRRYAQIMKIAVRHGLGGYLRGRRRTDPYQGAAKLARSLKAALNEGGVTFVKLGQMLSTRRDLIPGQFADQLATLQTSADPEPWPEIEAAIRAALGRPVAEVFASVDPEPMAAASVAQVHAARLLDGREVVLKVQRPRARAQVASDMEIILRLSRRLERSTPWGRSLRVFTLAKGFAASLDEELDYTVERDNLRSVAATLDGGIAVPEVVDEHSSGTLLVMTRLRGTPVGAAAPVLAALGRERRAQIAHQLLSEVLRQQVRTGVFHADLHPGNVLVDEDGGLGLLDFGSVGRLDDSTRRALGMLLLAVDRDDAIAATDALIELLDRPRGLAERDLERQIGQLMVRYRTGTGRGGSSGMFGSLLRVVHDNGFAVPPQIAAAFRALAALDGTLALISPDVDMVGAAREQGRALMREAAEPGKVRADLEERLAGYLPILQRLPRRINHVVEDLEQGRLSFNVRPLADDGDRRFLTGLVQQIVIAVLAGSATLGAIMLITADIGPMITPNIRLLAVAGGALLLIGFILALRSLALIFNPRSD